MERQRCPRCGEVVGSYEPIVLVMAEGYELRGSRLTLREELARPGAIAMHAACHATLADPP